MEESWRTGWDSGTNMMECVDEDEESWSTGGNRNGKNGEST